MWQIACHLLLQSGVWPWAIRSHTFASVSMQQNVSETNERTDGRLSGASILRGELTAKFHRNFIKIRDQPMPFGQLIIRKIIKIIATICHIFRLKCTKFYSQRLSVCVFDGVWHNSVLQHKLRSKQAHHATHWPMVLQIQLVIGRGPKNRPRRMDKNSSRKTLLFTGPIYREIS